MLEAVSTPPREPAAELSVPPRSLTKPPGSRPPLTVGSPKSSPVLIELGSAKIARIAVAVPNASSEPIDTGPTVSVFVAVGTPNV